MGRVFTRSLNNLARPNDFADRANAMRPLALKPRPSAVDRDMFRVLPQPGAYPVGSTTNIYHQVWRSIASSMMDISLFLSNANQLANVLRKPDFQTSWEMFEIISLALICSSIALQIVVGVVMITAKRRPPARDEAPDKYVESNRFASTCVFLIFVMNAMILCINNEPSHFRCGQVGDCGLRDNATGNATHNATEQGER